MVLTLWQRTLSAQRHLLVLLSFGGWISLLALVPSLALALRDVFLAYWFGPTQALDLYLLANVIPTAILSFAAAAFASAVIPVYIKHRVHTGKEAALVLFAVIFRQATLSLTVITLLLGVGFWMASWLAPIDSLLQLRGLFLLMLPAALLGGVAAMWSSLLNAEGRFAAAALAPSAVPMAAVVGCLAWQPPHDIRGLVMGTLLGYLLYTAATGGLAGRAGFTVEVRHGAAAQASKEVWQQYLPVIAAGALMSGNVVVDQLMASTLGPGSVSTLNFGQKIVLFVQSAVVMGLGTVLLPHFSRSVLVEDREALHRSLRAMLWLVAGLGTVVAILLGAWADEIVRLVFQRGAFSSTDASVVAHVQRLYAIQIPFFAMGTVLTRLLFALQRGTLLLASAVISFALNIALNVLFMTWLGVAGIALSTSAVYAMAALFLYTRAIGLVRSR
jgi:putative peptidoglycan lipid II flippase